MPVVFLFQIVLVMLKLTGTIAWSWWIVFLPTVASSAVIIFCMLLLWLVALWAGRR